MNDAIQELVKTVGENEPFLCSLATVDSQGSPQVRFVRAKVDEAHVLRIPTFLGTGKVEQIRADGRVHVICGRTDAQTPGSYFQIEGTASIVTDAEERRRGWTPRLEKWFSGVDDPNYAVVRIEPSRIVALPIGHSGSASVWTADS